MTDITRVPTLDDIYASKDAMDDIQSFTYDVVDTFVDANSVTRDTVTGRIKKMGYTVPIAYAIGIVFAVDDNVKTVEEAGVVYAPLPSALPFTTSGTFIGDDDARFFVIQGVTFSSLEDRYFDTLAEALADLDLNSLGGQTVHLKERISGEGGKSSFITIAGTGTANTWNIVAHSTISISLVLINNTPVDLKQWGAGLGLTDDRTIFQSAMDQGFRDFLNTKGVYLIGDSGTTVPYRLSTVKVGVNCPSNLNMKFLGKDAYIKTMDGSNVTPLVAYGKVNVTFKEFRIEGNAINQTPSLSFGIYCLNCDGVEYDKLTINETYDNTLETIGCTNVIHGTSNNNTSSAGGSIGGGPQFEDCENVDIEVIDGNTFDDILSVIAMSADTKNITVGQVKGKSDNSRGFFIGQSGSAIAQRTLDNIVVSALNTHDCGKIGLTAAFALNNGGIFKGVKVTVIDNGSYETGRVTPYDATFNGQLIGCEFKVIAADTDTVAFKVNHNDNPAIVIENNVLEIISNNPNVLDASPESGVEILGGDGWDIKLNVRYPSGKTNPAPAVTLGTVGATNAVVRKSRVHGIIRGGADNIKLVNTEDIDTNGLSLYESSTDISLNIQAGAIRTKVGNPPRDGRIQDLSTTTQRSITQLYMRGTIATTGGATIETDLMAYTLPANWMHETGMLHIKASGVNTGANDNKTITFYWDGIAHIIHAAANNVDNWSADIYIFGQGLTNSQRLEIQSLKGTVIEVNDVASDAGNTTTASVIKFTGQVVNAGDAVTQRTMLVEGY